MSATEASEQPAGLLHLPDDLLASVLRPLPLAERERGAALVCRRLHRLCTAPELNRSVDCSADIAAGDAEARLHRLARWLARRAGGVRQLQLCAAGTPAALRDEEHCMVADGWHLDVLPLGRAFLAAAGAAGALDKLTLRAGRLPLLVGEPSGPPLPPVRCLSVCQSGFGTALVVAGALTQGIEDLELAAPKGALRVQAGATFPASLTALRLAGSLGWTDFPEPHIEPTLPQLAALSGLQRLQLAGTHYAAEACGTLPHLPALTQLRIADGSVDWWWCMCTCTQLQRLSLKHCDYLWMGDPVQGRAAPALTWLECHFQVFSRFMNFAPFPSLPGLRQLVWWEWKLPPIPPAWAALTRLELLTAAAEESAAELQAARAANPTLAVAMIDEEDGPHDLPPSLHQVKQECAALQSWVRSLGSCVPKICLDTASRRRRCEQGDSTGAPAVQQAGAGGSGQPMAEQRCAGGATAAELEPVEDSLSRALGGDEVLDLEPAETQPQRLAEQWSAYLDSRRTFDMDFGEALQFELRLERIDGLLAEAAAAANASVHLLHTLMCRGIQTACVAPESVWVLTLDARRRFS